MNIQLCRQDDDIVKITDYSDIKDEGEISHFLTELESIKLDLLELWDEYSEIQ